jgi:hypothetical protein
LPDRKAKTTLAAHPRFVVFKDAATETELRAKVNWPGDEDRLGDLNIFFVHTPQARN